MDHRERGSYVAALWITGDDKIRRAAMEYLESLPRVDAYLVLFWTGYYMDRSVAESFHIALRELEREENP